MSHARGGKRRALLPHESGHHWPVCVSSSAAAACLNFACAQPVQNGEEQRNAGKEEGVRANVQHYVH